MNVSFSPKKALLAAGAGALTAALLGSAALAAFAPVTYDSPSEVAGEIATTAPADRGTDKLKPILDGLVVKGVITPAQEDAILAAVKTAAPGHHKSSGQRIFANLFEESAKYLGLSAADLKSKLPGTSLGAIADKTPGKSQLVLVTTLQNVTNAAIDKALAEAKLTKEQADKARAEAPAHIKKFVERIHSQARAPKSTTRGAKVNEYLGDVYSAAREYLGLSQADLQKALRDGKTLGEVATAAGKSKTELVAKITLAANAKIDKAASAGKLTAEQATALKAQVGPAVAALVDRKLKTAINKP
jgi:hypothetical protein